MRTRSTVWNISKPHLEQTAAQSPDVTMETSSKQSLGKMLQISSRQQTSLRGREREREKLHTGRIGSRGIGARRVRSTRVVREPESFTEASSPTARYNARSAKMAAFSKEETSFSRRHVSQSKEKGKRRRNSASSRKIDQQNSRAWGRRVQRKREASRTRRAIAADRSANDIAQWVMMTRERKS